MRLRPGDAFGRYAVVSVLDEDADGALYRARDRNLGRSVTLRTMSLDTREGVALWGRARTASGLQHGALVTVFDVGSIGSVGYVATEWIEGAKSLARVVTAGSSPLGTRFVWARTLAEALVAAHGAGLVHGGLTLGSVLVVEGEGIKLTGIEIPASKRSAATAEDDQLAWGLLVYELLGGVRPWPSKDGAMTPLRKIDPAIPDEVDRVVLKAISADPRDRFASMAALVTALGGGVRSDATTVSAPPVAPPSHVPGPPQASRWRGYATRGALAIAVAGAAFGTVRLARDRPAIDVAPVTLATIDAPESPVPQAVAAYRAGLQAIRDASGEAARDAMEQATEIDATFGAAHLRYVVSSATATSRAREHANAAVTSRATLNAHDRALLEAYLPWAMAPQDASESERRLDVLASAHPDDADFAFHLCRMRAMTGHYESAIAACDTSLRLDPAHLGAWHLEALAAVFLGDVPRARSAFDACLGRSRFAMSCAYDLLELEAREGRCAEASSLARKMIAAAPDNADAYEVLGWTMLAEAKPRESVLLALTKSWELRPHDARPVLEAYDRALLATAVGELGKAERDEDAWARALAAWNDEEAHATLAATRIELALETGRTDDAKHFAEDFTSRRSGWTPIAAYDASIYPLVWRRRLGMLDRAGFRRARDAWIVGEKERPAAAGMLGPRGGLLWALAYALPALDADDARDALAALPRFAPLPDAYTRSEVDRAIGDVYRLANRADEAIPFYARAAASCVNDLPVERIQATLRLGEMYEARGDAIEACRAYARVLDRWSHASGSISAARAREHVRALRCEAPITGARSQSR